jgi:histone demethylase JARID1
MPVPEAPVFRPTAAEFSDPLKYINSIRAEGQKAGICRVIPPAGWKPPFALNKSKFRFKTR